MHPKDQRATPRSKQNYNNYAGTNAQLREVNKNYNNYAPHGAPETKHNVGKWTQWNVRKQNMRALWQRLCEQNSMCEKPKASAIETEKSTCGRGANSASPPSKSEMDSLKQRLRGKNRNPRRYLENGIRGCGKTT